MTSNGKLPSYNIADLAYPDIQEYLKAQGYGPDPGGQHRAARPAPAALDRHRHRGRGVAAGGRQGAGALHALRVDGLLAAAHARAGQGFGTITVRAETFNNLLYDIARSLIHHGFNRIIFVAGHGSNVKIVDPLLRRLKYETGALVAYYKPYAERYMGLLKGLMENPPDETPGWHASELETSQMLAHNARLVRMDRAVTDHHPQAALAARGFHQGRRRARHRVPGLPVLPVPDGPPRVQRHRRDRQPLPRHRRERRESLHAVRRPPGGRHRRAAEGAVESTTGSFLARVAVPQTSPCREEDRVGSFPHSRSG